MNWFLLLLGCVWLTAGAARAADGVRVLVHEKGQTRTLTGAAADAVQHECERLLAGAKNRMLLLVTPDRIQAVERKAAAVEVIYPEPALLELEGRQVRVMALLVPLGGSLPENLMVYRLEGGRAYSATDHVLCEHGTEALKQVLKANNFKLK
ncbi:hypothetical protein [Paludibaculum fermentans]|uniref:Uncharacterized protein n=1 Tax=Paludibaculum fermentans TaxID=1473598 RepID=A0A7S7SM57_PALFE|nr:hypothetical protein [Paludibaculum fermentans]QOY89166.1 hypothetical protein IRI77_04185 [Paludibaculum fermentans]